ncbi:Ig-like domain (group 2), partial [Pseudomonas sp. ok272]|uniref:Ig-like domain-containing protein n=1 Tax=unclassified Pseudomonas TaxID=196821 RepID=UPI0008AFA545
KNLKDGSSLSMELKAALGKSTVESEAVVFPVRTYTIKALVEEKPEITSVKDAYGNEVANDTIIVNDAVDLTGTATAGLEVEIFDGTTSIGTSTVNASGVWTYRVQGMNVGPHRLTAKALYGSNPVSAPRTFSVAIALVPAITSVTDSKGNDIPNNGTTRDTTVNLTGTATASLEVEIFDGATSTGKRPVNANGVWTHSVQSMGGGSHSLTAKALYGSQQSSAPYAVTVITTPELIIDQEPMVLDGIKLIQNDGWLTKEVAGNVKSRTPTGGQGPFTYESSRPDIASVDGNGKVSGLKQGQAQITVKDALQNSATYSVTVSNVYRMLRNWVYREFTGHVSWIEASGGITATAARDCALAINTNFANLLTTGPFHPSLRPEVARHAVFDPTRDSTGGFPRYQGAYWDSSTGIVSTQMSPVTFWGGAFAFVPLV